MWQSSFKNIMDVLNLTHKKINWILILYLHWKIGKRSFSLVTDSPAQQ